MDHQTDSSPKKSMRSYQAGLDSSSSDKKLYRGQAIVNKARKKQALYARLRGYALDMKPEEEGYTPVFEDRFKLFKRRHEEHLKISAELGMQWLADRNLWQERQERRERQERQERDEAEAYKKQLESWKRRMGLNNPETKEKLTRMREQWMVSVGFRPLKELEEWRERVGLDNPDMEEALARRKKEWMDSVGFKPLPGQQRRA